MVSRDLVAVTVSLASLAVSAEGHHIETFLLPTRWGNSFVLAADSSRFHLYADWKSRAYFVTSSWWGTYTYKTWLSRTGWMLLSLWCFCIEAT